MNEWINQAVGTVVVAIVSGLVGWLASSFKMVPRSELIKRMNEINERLEEIESEQKLFVTRAEFRDTLGDLKESLATQHNQLRDQLNQINATLLSRRGPTQG